LLVYLGDARSSKLRRREERGVGKGKAKKKQDKWKITAGEGTAKV